MKIASFKLLALAFLALGSPLQAEQPVAPGGKIRVACVGDSITQGAGADNGKSYPSQLQEILGPKYEVGNFGVSGRTLLNKGDYPYTKESAYQKAKDFQPNAVIIMLGTNDTKPQNWKHQSEFAADYKALVTSFKTLESKPQIFVCRPCPVPEPGNFGITETNVKLEIPMIDKLAEEEKLEVIDMHAALEATPALLPDRVHPNTEGAKVMAETAAKAVSARALQAK